MSKRKRLGQNFLIDEAIAREIVDIADPTSVDHILEIGPGHGILTKNLIPRVGRLTAVEIDPNLCTQLQKMFSDRSHFRLIQGDAVKFDVGSLEPPLKVVSNLPYYAATHILKRLIGYRIYVSEMTVMLQKEVVDRLVAKPGQSDYSSLTVFIQFYCQVERCLEVNKESFSPKPKINSSVIRLVPFKNPPVHVINEKAFFQIVHAAFLHKRKMLKNNLKPWSERFSIESENITLAGIDLNRRGETLSLADFAALSNSLQS